MKPLSLKKTLVRPDLGFLLTLVIPLMAAGCGQSNVSSFQEVESTPKKPLKVVATFLPMYYFTKAVAGEAAEVRMLVPAGTEIHEYQSTPKDIQTITQADVLVKNGLGLEEFLDNTVSSAQNSRLVEIDASQGIQPLGEISPVINSSESTRTGADPAHEEETGETTQHEHQGNPHVWLDPVLAKQQVETIRNGLIAADPNQRATYQANAAAYIQQLEELDNQYEQRLKRYQNRTFVTFHDAFPYLAQRYQLQQVAVVAIPEDNLSPTDIQKTVSAVKQYKVKAILGEPGVDNKLLQSLSSDLNLTLRSLNSLESGSQDPQYYFTAMKANLQTIESAFQ